MKERKFYYFIFAFIFLCCAGEKKEIEDKIHDLITPDGFEVKEDGFFAEEKFQYDMEEDKLKAEEDGETIIQEFFDIMEVECSNDEECLFIIRKYDPCAKFYCDQNEKICKLEKLSDGTPCDDLDPCSIESVCKDGICSVVTPLNCDDKNTCTTDLCKSDKGCVYEFNTIECEDGDPCTQGDKCSDGNCISGKNTCEEKEICNNKKDDDGDGFVDCFDQDCWSNEECKVAKSEICNNGIDDDGDLKKDCEDSDCKDHPSCKQVNKEVCNNNIDDDEDGFTDCKDQDCWSSPSCLAKVEDCTNKIDDDDDGIVDCKDPDCFLHPSCIEPPEEICNNKIDDDDDGKIDCKDEDCANDPLCVPPPQEICDNKKDDDLDGYIDCKDSDCKEFPSCILYGECHPKVDLNCGDTGFGTLLQSGLPSLINSYGCLTGKDYSYNGPEMTFRFIPKCTANATITIKTQYLPIIENEVPLLPKEKFLDLFIINDEGGLCNSKNCFAYALMEFNETDWTGTATLKIKVVQKTTYYIVVDGRNGAKNAFSIEVKCDCETPPKEICNNEKDDDKDGFIDCKDQDCWNDPACIIPPLENCNNKKDDDGDGLVDCKDPDCFNDPLCKAEGECLPVEKLNCGDKKYGDLFNKNTTDNLDSYSCVDNNYKGPEYSYTFISKCKGKAIITLTQKFFEPLPLEDLPPSLQNFLDVFILSSEGGKCEGKNCISYGLMKWTNYKEGIAKVEFIIEEKKLYYVVVDGRNGATGNYLIKADCECETLPKEICNNEKDDDGDKLVDCKDPDCSNDPVCMQPPAEICNNGKDDDGDGFIDCKDQDCWNDPSCIIPPQEICNNNKDDDGDKLVDCKDPDCSNNPSCVPSGECKPYKDIKCNDEFFDNLFSGTTDNITKYNCSDYSYDAPEKAYNFTSLCDGKVKITLTTPFKEFFFDSDGNASPLPPPYNELIDLFIIDTNDGICNSNKCIASGFMKNAVTEVNFSVKKGEKFAFVIEDRNGKGNVFFKVKVKCECSEPPKEICFNKIDDDGDGFIDCKDSDCKDDPACKPTAGCKPVEELKCGFLLPGSLLSEGTTDNIDSYKCLPFGNYKGPEYTYWFNAGNCEGNVIVTVISKGGVIPFAQPFPLLDVFILDGSKGACSGLNCIAYGLMKQMPSQGGIATTTFKAKKAGIYYIVIDGRNGSAGEYTISLQCPQCEGEGKIEICNNKKDDDGDNLIDCKDPDCFNNPYCKIWF